MESAQEFCRSLGGTLDFDWVIEPNQLNNTFTSWKLAFFTYWTFRHRIWIFNKNNFMKDRVDAFSRLSFCPNPVWAVKALNSIDYKLLSII